MFVQGGTPSSGVGGWLEHSSLAVLACDRCAGSSPALQSWRPGFLGFSPLRNCLSDAGLVYLLTHCPHLLSQSSSFLPDVLRGASGSPASLHGCAHGYVLLRPSLRFPLSLPQTVLSLGNSKTLYLAEHSHWPHYQCLELLCVILVW